jgi:hypothetical protein
MYLSRVHAKIFVDGKNLALWMMQVFFNKYQLSLKYHNFKGPSTPHATLSRYDSPASHLLSPIGKRHRDRVQEIRRNAMKFQRQSMRNAAAVDSAALAVDAAEMAVQIAVSELERLQEAADKAAHELERLQALVKVQSKKVERLRSKQVYLYIILIKQYSQLFRNIQKNNSKN